MKKCIFILITACVFQTSIHAETSSPSPTSTIIPKSTASETEQLFLEIQTLRKKALNAEMEAQELLLTQWDEYVQKIEEADRYREQATLLEKRIKELRIKNPTPPPPTN